MPSNTVEKKGKDGSVIYRLNRETGAGHYFITNESSQSRFISEVTLEGFRTFPKSLYPTGFGFKVSGSQLLQELHDEYGAKLRITLSATSPSQVSGRKTVTRVTLHEPALIQANRLASEVKRKKAQEIRAIVAEFLGKELPSVFSNRDTGILEYRPHTIADLLEDDSVIENLSDRDESALKAIYPHLIGEMVFSLRSAKQVKIVADGIKASQKVYLQTTIEDFEKKLKSNSSESVWQKFLHQHILTLLNIYAHVIEKQSVELDGKYPDFMLVDAYGYVDIYEIKKSTTNLLKLDKSRKNYFWDPELSRAVIQTEKYISSVERNRYELEAKLRKSGSEARIVRPRGFIIAGTRTQLANDSMAEDFRVLNDSLKNVDVICFDDLLDNLRALRTRLTSDGGEG